MSGLLMNWSSFLLCGMITASLFFLMAGLRELKSLRLEGVFYLTLAGFFAAVHIYYFYNLPVDSPVAYWLSQMNFWDWSVEFFAPAVIILFLVLGLISFGFSRYRAGLIKIFFGLTLVCYLFMVGDAWPVDVKGIIALVWSFLWFSVELSSVY